MPALAIDWERFAPQRAVVGGLIMAVASQILMYTLGQIAGISGILRNAIQGTLGWQTSFVAGLLLAGVWTSVTTHALEDSTMANYYGALTPSSVVPTKGLTILAALVMGFGATMANGCTSGHGVCGIGRASPRSTTAVATFMLAGMVASSIVRFLKTYYVEHGKEDSLLGKVASLAYRRASEDPYWTLQSDKFQHETFTAAWGFQLGLFVLYVFILAWYLQYKKTTIYDLFPFLGTVRDVAFPNKQRRLSVASDMARGGYAPELPFESDVADIGETEETPAEDAKHTNGASAGIAVAAANGTAQLRKKPAGTPVPAAPVSQNKRTPAEYATLINQHLIAIATGFMFGYGLVFSGMGNPERVQSFLDPLGFGSKWDPTLMFVMGGAVLPNLVVFRLMRDSELDVQILHGPHGKPVPFSQAVKYGPVEANMKIDRNLIVGSILFGASWGALGVCPGPGIVSFATAHYPTTLAVPFIGLGAILRTWLSTL